MSGGTTATDPEVHVFLVTRPLPDCTDAERACSGGAGRADRRVFGRSAGRADDVAEYFDVERHECDDEHHEHDGRPSA